MLIYYGYAFEIEYEVHKIFSGTQDDETTLCLNNIKPCAVHYSIMFFYYDQSWK